MLDFDREQCWERLARWARSAERDWYPLPGRTDLGCYGTGYNAWGVQTNQKYVGALAALATLSPEGLVDREWAQQRARAALRFSLDSHVSGDLTCTDGTRWGQTWISALGLERMMFGVALLEPHLTGTDRDSLRRVLTGEADWLLHYHHKGPHQGVFGDVWNHTGKNVPESNLWDGALLWRTAVMFPDDPRAGDWQEQAHRFLINSVSVPADASDARVVAGKPVRERHAGANFFPHYALDHHGYLNVGYMVICVSNASLLHFDLKAAGLPRPESLDHHEADLWGVLRRMIFPDGRLARIGGDTRVRYAYCQDYLLPALMYAADYLGDAHAPELLRGLLGLMGREQDTNPDGSFYGSRLATMRAGDPYYFCRLESDRAAVLAFLLTHADRVAPPPAPRRSFESSVAGGWSEPEHGAVLHRGRRRLASFAWRAHGLTQGLCLPPGHSDLAEWRQNLAGSVRCMGDDGVTEGGQTHRRELRSHAVIEFPGGFLTYGEVREGLNLTVAEGWAGSHALSHRLAFAALPDGQTVLGLQHCRNGEHRAFLAEVQGLLLNVPNDLFSGYRRGLLTAQGRTTLRSPAPREEVLPLGSPWAVVDGCLGVMGLYGAAELSVSRSPVRRGGKYHSLYVEEICYPCRRGTWAADPGETVLDCGWAVVASATAAQMRAFAEANVAPSPPGLPPDLRAVVVTGRDGRRYLLALNIGAAPVPLTDAAWIPTGMASLDHAEALPAGAAALFLEG